MSFDAAENGSASDAADLFAWLARESRELAPSSVPRVPSPPSALAFSRDYVARNLPVVVEGAIAHWPASRGWSPEHMASRAGESALISVNVTPNGLGDALLATDGVEVVRADPDDDAGDDETDDAPAPAPPVVFAQPEERSMTFRAFLAELNRTRALPADDPSYCVPYVSRQCGSLREEFPALAAECVDLEWATEAFGAAPDAVNLWCGDERARTTFHRDHYENIYCVINGSKTFELVPPCQGIAMMRAVTAPAATFEGAAVVLESPARSVRWWADPVANPGLVDGSKAKESIEPLTVTVRAGEALYLPAMWFHAVTQRGAFGDAETGEYVPATAVNFWYDMHFGDRFAWSAFAEEARRRWGGERVGGG
jgi:jumonji domain-containing protein 7